MNTLEQLYAELDLKLEQRLSEIEQECQARIARLEQEQAERLRTRLEQVRRTQQNQLRQLRLKANRETCGDQQTRLWQCQQRCIDDLLIEARSRLAQRPPDSNYLETWVSPALERLPAGASPVLKLSQAWLQANGISALPVTVAPILGGAILSDPATGIEIDGSWDRRLETLTPELWQRWLKDAGTDDPH